MLVKEVLLNVCGHVVALCISVTVFFKLLIGGGGGLISYGLKLVTSKGLFVAPTGILLLMVTVGF